MLIQENIELAKFTSFKIGGKARYFAEVKTPTDFIAALQLAAEKKVPYLVLGGGTNCLVRDQGFTGLVIRNQLRGLDLEDDLIIAETGLALPEIHNFANKHGLTGFEKLATVPGTLGGAIYNNAHYMDSLLADFIAWVEIINPETLEIERLAKDQLGFKYDSSNIKIKNLPALRAGLRLLRGDPTASRRLFLELLKKRADSQPYGTLNSGCVFQNVPVQLGPGHNGTSAGWLIEQCGLKGARIGGAVISEKHGNFFINQGGASSSDILALAEMCKNKVKEKYAVDLEYEIKII